MTEFGGTELIHSVQEWVDTWPLANKVMAFEFHKRWCIYRLNGRPKWLMLMLI